MPTNNWRHQLFATDLIAALQEDDPEQFPSLRNQLVHRIRTAEFYNPVDPVLCGLVDYLARAATLQELGQEWDTFYLWADQGQQLWIETSLPLEKFNEHQDRNCREPFVAASDETKAVVATAPLLHDAFLHPPLVQAVVDWCEVTGTDPATLATDAEFQHVATVLNAFMLLSFHNQRWQVTPEVYQQHVERAALVLLAGAHLATRRQTPVRQATDRAARLVTQLGMPTGYESDPLELAKKIDSGVPLART